MCKTHLKNDTFCSKSITFPNHMMNNHIFEHLNVYFDVMFLYMNNTFLSPLMQNFYIYNRNKYSQWTQVSGPENERLHSLIKRVYKWSKENYSCDIMKTWVLGAVDRESLQY